MIQDNYVKLTEISKEYFNLSPETASRKASLGLLPVPAVRFSGTRQGPLFVARDALDKYIKEQAGKAAKLHARMA